MSHSVTQSLPDRQLSPQCRKGGSRWSALLDPDPHKAVLCPTGIYDQFCSVFRDVTQIFEASPGAVLLQLRPFPDFACEQVETALMPAADQAKISSDRAFRVWKLQCFGLSGAAAFVKRQMKVRACVVEGTVGVGSANNDDVAILKIENPAFVGLKLAFGKSTDPPPATLTNGFASPLGI